MTTRRPLTVLSFHRSSLSKLSSGLGPVSSAIGNSGPKSSPHILTSATATTASNFYCHCIPFTLLFLFSSLSVSSQSFLSPSLSHYFPSFYCKRQTGNMRSHIQLLGNRVQMLTRLNPNSRPRVLIQCRGLATATPAKEILPLKGIKVLDMTRVLAGVSTSCFLRFPLLVICFAFWVVCGKYTGSVVVVRDMW